MCLSPRGGGRCLILMGPGSPSLKVPRRHFLTVSLASWLARLNRPHRAQRWPSGRALLLSRQVGDPCDLKASRQMALSACLV